MTTLSDWGVTMLVGDDVYEQHDPGTGDRYIHLFPWHLAWQALLTHPWRQDQTHDIDADVTTPSAPPPDDGFDRRPGF